MADKKIVTLDQLKTYDTKVKEKLNEKLDKSGDQVLDGNLTLTGDLNVQGTTNTVNQETLTVKDNLIAVNGDGTTLAASGKAGIVIVDGKERSFLISDYYEFDIEALLDFVSLRVVNISTDPNKVIYSLKTDNDIYNLFNSINLVPIELKLQDGSNITDSFGSFFIGSFGGDYNNTISLNIVINGDKTYSNILVSINLDENSGTYSIVDNKTQFLLSSTILSDKNIEDLSHFLKHSNSQKYISEENIKKEATAYAAPIYDVESDSLKLGLGTFTRDENGNIIDFVFGENQEQSIATRSNVFNNEYPAVPYWDPEKQCFTANLDNDGMYAFMDGAGLGGLRELHTKYIDLSRGMGQVIYSEDLGDDKEVLVLENRHSQVKFYREDMVTGEPAKLTIDGKQVATLDDIETQSIDINLKNGTGTDSIVQKVSTIDPTDPTDFENTATADSGVTFGKSNTNTGKRTFVIGKGNTNNGANNIVGGNSNNISEQGLNSFVGGYKNTVTAGSVIVVGQDNTNNGQYSIIGGNSNTNNGSDALVIGQDNKNDGDRSVVGGLENENTGKSAIVGGFGNINNTDDAFVAGHYNLPVEDALLVIGNGEWKQGDAEPTRSNAFEVLKDGTIKCNGKPLGTNSVTLDTNQTVTGKKTFENRVIFKESVLLGQSTNGVSAEVIISENEPAILFNGPSIASKITRTGIFVNSKKLTYPSEGGTIATEEKLEGKLDIVSSQETGNIYCQVYGTQRAIGQKMFNVQAADAVYGPGWIAVYGNKDTSGVNDPLYDLRTSTPKNPYHCTNKQYVDTALDGKIDVENIDDYPEYDSETTYNAGSIVKSNGILYGSLKASNKGNPLTDTEWWVKTPLLVLPPVSTLYNTTYLVGVNGTTKRVEQMSMQNASADGSTRPGAFTVMRTGANGVFTVGDPVGQYHATNKQYVDTALEGKLDIDNSTTKGFNRVYAVNANGTQSMYAVQRGANPGQYHMASYMPDAYGYGETEPTNDAWLVQKNPIKSYHLANKNYVDKGMWLPAYDETVTYAKDVMVVKNGKIYKSLIDDNIGNLGNTETEATSWEDLLSGKLDKVTTAPLYTRVYAVNGKGEQALIGTSVEPYQYRLAQYMPSGTIGEGVGKFNAILKVGTPIVGNDATNKDYVDAALENKLDKDETTSYFHRLYGVTAAGAQKLFEIPDSTAGATPNRIPVYFANTSGSDTTPPTGVLLTGTPTRASHAANKLYVDTLVGDIESTLDSIIAIQNSLIGGNE